MPSAKRKFTILISGSLKNIKRNQPPRKIKFIIEEVGGDQYKSLEEAQKAALPYFVDSLVSIIKRLLDEGKLVIRDGKIVPADPDEKTE